jgi:hypothetical protein
MDETTEKGIEVIKDNLDGVIVNKDINILVLKSEKITMVSEPTLNVRVSIKETRQPIEYHPLAVDISAGLNVGLPKDKDLNVVISGIVDNLKTIIVPKKDELLDDLCEKFIAREKNKSQTKQLPKSKQPKQLPKNVPKPKEESTPKSNKSKDKQDKEKDTPELPTPPPKKPTTKKARKRRPSAF